VIFVAIRETIESAESKSTVGAAPGQAKVSLDKLPGILECLAPGMTLKKNNLLTMLAPKFSIFPAWIARGLIGKSSRLSLCILITILSTGSSFLHAQISNPLENDSRAARAGGVLFRSQCATCHGADAGGIQGIDAPDLRQLWSVGERSDEQVFNTIKNGVSGSIMPAHPFPDTEIWMLVTYLQSVAPVVESLAPDGNASQGRALFTSHCSECHSISGSGGTLGPDLSLVSRSRSRQALVNAVRSPSQAIASGFKPVNLMTADNQAVTGVIKSEDAFSIQVMDTNQNLRGFQKFALRNLEYPVASLMPVFDQARLSDQELEDILSFLATPQNN